MTASHCRDMELLVQADLDNELDALGSATLAICGPASRCCNRRGNGKAQPSSTENVVALVAAARPMSPQ